VAQNRLAERLKASRVISRRELRSSVFGLSIYLPVFFSFVVAYLLIKNYVTSIEGNGIMVLANPLNYPFYICVMISSIYLAMSSAISIAREKEQGTLEVLFYGPVDTQSYLLGKFSEQMGAYLIILAFNIAYFLLASFVTNFGFSISFIKIVVLSLFLVSSMISFGTLISTITAKVRTSVLLFLGLVIAFLGLQFLGTILGNIQPDDLSSIAAYVRNFVSAIVSVVQWVSPFSYLNRGIDAVSQGSNMRYAISLLSSVAYSLVLMIISAIVFDRRGVRKG
jgi:ABC-type transport system involved in multi-copper enzyme maturation permease subunit